MNNKFRFRIASESMSPLLKVGDEIVWEKVITPASDLRRFDLIVFRQNNKLFCHYLWSINSHRDVYVTKPLQSTDCEDLPLSSSDILGRLVSHRMNLYWRIKVVLCFLF